MSWTGGPRRVAVLLHRWSGLVIGLLWSIQGLTGALLVFQPQIERAGHRPFSVTTMVSLDHIVRQAQAASGAPIRRLALPDRAIAVINADYATTDHQGRFVRIDAQSGAVLAVTASAPGVAAPATGWGWVRAFHERALLGQGGAGLIAVSGLFLLAALGLGAWIGWPRPGKWRSSFDVARWRNPPQRRYGWHRAIGLAVAVPLMIIASAGVYMAILGFSNPPGSMSAVWVSPPIGPQRAYEVAQERFPKAAFSSVQMPTQARGLYGVRLTQPGEARQRAGRTLVEVDARTGRIAKIYDPLHAPLAARLSDLLLPVHYGGIAGLMGQILVAAAGLSLPVLYGLGLWMWLAKRPVWRNPARDGGRR